ncbi:MAG: thiamine diphosphokinase [Coriobacteriia bacterium]
MLDVLSQMSAGWALVVGGSPEVSLTHVRESAEAASLVVAADSGGAACLAAGVTPDVLVGDLDSIDPQVLAELTQGGVEVARHPEDKDETDLELALAEARSRGASEVLVTGVWGARADHSLAAVGALLAAADLRPVVIESGFVGWVLSAPHRSRAVIEAPGSTVSVFSLTPGSRARSEGLAWPLAGARLSVLAPLGVSNRVIEERAWVECEQGTLVVLVVSEDD